VIEAIVEVFAMRDRLRGLRIVEAPAALRHFTAHLAPAHGALYAPAEADRA